jgi:hypothetical protein
MDNGEEGCVAKALGLRNGSDLPYEVQKTGEHTLSTKGSIVHVTLTIMESPGCEVDR